MALDLVFAARVAGQDLVADIANADIKGMLGPEIGRQFDLGGIVHCIEGRRRRARIMGRGEGNISEEWLVVIGAARVQKVDHLVAEDGGGVAVRKISLLGRIFASGIEIVNGHGVLIVHAAEEDHPALPEAAGIAAAPIMPFAGAKGGVSVLLQQLRQQRHIVW